MSTPHGCAATFFKILKSILLSHLGLQSVTYRVETPCSLDIYIYKMAMNGILVLACENLTTFLIPKDPDPNLNLNPCSMYLII